MSGNHLAGFRICSSRDDEWDENSMVPNARQEVIYLGNWVTINRLAKRIRTELSWIHRNNARTEVPIGKNERGGYILVCSHMHVRDILVQSGPDGVNRS